MLKNFKGITLIALVVTIVILLILSGIAIVTLTGNNGLITQANRAKEETEKAEEEEKYNLAQQEDLINEYATGIKVEQVTDTNPGVLGGTGTEIDPYIINSIEDLVFFAYDVTNGNTYEGEYVSLGLSLDFNSTKSYADPFRSDYGKYGYDGELKTLLTTGEGFKSIGIETSENSETLNFYGTFDGNNYTISNLYINKNVNDGDSYQFYGLFASNYGTILNLNINININIESHKNTIVVGGISGLNYGTIENCSSDGDISIEGYQENGYIAVGGISGQIQREANINKCKNNSNIYCKAKTLYVGGIVGSNNSNVLNSYNVGNIQIDKNSELCDIRCRRYNRIYRNREY